MCEIIKLRIRATNVDVSNDDSEKDNAETDGNTKSRNARSDRAGQKFFIKGNDIDEAEINQHHERSEDPAKTGPSFYQFKVIRILGDREDLFVIHEEMVSLLDRDRLL